MKKLIKKTLASFYYLFVERYSSTMKTPVLRQMLYTLRFRMAGLGLYLTKNEKALASLKNKYKGHRCFIIGNGPSLNKLDLTKLKDEYTFGVNAIYLNYDKMKFHPTFYVIEDYLVAEDRAEEINKYLSPQVKFYGTYLDYVLKKDKNTLLMNVIRNYEAPKFQPLFSENCTRYLGVGGSVTFICLQLAFYMGFDEVYMIGFDHSYKVPEEANVINNPVIKSIQDDVNHFSPDYFGKGYRWHDPRVDRMEAGFKKAREIYEKNNKNIYNATVEGHLEVFTRVNFETLFESNKDLIEF